MTAPSSNELHHYGVPGMKWGKRKQSDGSVKTTGRQAKKAAAEERRNSIKKMSDTELREKINRIKMEKEFAKLTSEDTARGRQTANRILSTTGNMAMNVAKNVAQQRMASMINGMIDAAITNK